jgi:signal peptidase I
MDSLPFKLPKLFQKLGKSLTHLVPATAIEIRGNSMQPTYQNGDWLIFGTARFPKRLMNKVIVLERESYPGILLVKRVTQILERPSGHLEFWVEGDNKEESTDSRHWGAVGLSEIRGRIWLRYKRGRQKS